MTDKPKSVEDLNPPEEFHKIVNDFISDILITFPEYSGLISKWWNRQPNSDDLELTKQKEALFVFRHCVKIFPERFLIFYTKIKTYFHKILKSLLNFYQELFLLNYGLAI